MSCFILCIASRWRLWHSNYSMHSKMFGIWIAHYPSQMNNGCRRDRVSSFRTHLQIKHQKIKQSIIIIMYYRPWLLTNSHNCALAAWFDVWCVPALKCSFIYMNRVSLTWCQFKQQFSFYVHYQFDSKEKIKFNVCSLQTQREQNQLQKKFIWKQPKMKWTRKKRRWRRINGAKSALHIRHTLHTHTHSYTWCSVGSYIIFEN